MDNSTAEK